MRTFLFSIVIFSTCFTHAETSFEPPKTIEAKVAHLEKPSDPQLPPSKQGPGDKADITRGQYRSVQTNVTNDGLNILGDAANEPSIAVDPTAPNRMAVGWRQFDTTSSSFRKGGYAFTQDGGRSWTFPGNLEETVFRSDPVLEADSEGRFYYYSLLMDEDDPNLIVCDMWLSDDGGASWYGRIPAWGGDKAWTTIDQSGGIGHDNYYASWTTAGIKWGTRVFTRSTNRGLNFMSPVTISPAPIWGTMTVGPEGELYIGGNAAYNFDIFVLWKSLDAADPDINTPTFELTHVDLGGQQGASYGPNPAGLLGQIWVDVDRTDGPNRGNVYMLGSVNPFGNTDPMDVHFVRSTDGGVTFSEPLRVNSDDRNAWQWFGTMSVAPNGRIDVIWVESFTRGNPDIGELYYSFSEDAGYSFSTAEAITPSFDSSIGWPRQQKMGDYYDMVSDKVGANLIYTATFNGEQDVYYLRINDYDCNNNGIGDLEDISSLVARDCNNNEIPDSCEVAAMPELDSTGDGFIDSCTAEPRRSGGRIQ